MKVGDLVTVETKFYGVLLGIIIKVSKDGFLIKPNNHTRNILGLHQDVKLLVSA